MGWACGSSPLPMFSAPDSSNQTIMQTQITLAQAITINMAMPDGTAHNVIMGILRPIYRVVQRQRLITASIPPLRKPVLLYGAGAFAAHAADTDAQHTARLQALLGSDMQAALQALQDDATPLALQTEPAAAATEISNWRAKAVLAQMGLLAQVEAALDALPEPQRTVVGFAWNGDAKFAKDSPTLLALAAGLGMDAAGLDEFFAAAAAISI